MRVRAVFRKKTRASVSVFFLLVLSFLLSLLFALRTAVLESTRKLQIEQAMNTSMNAVFAEYHRELLDQYDILAIDTSYGTSSTDAYNTAGHLQSYMNGNFGKGMLKDSDMLGLTAEDVAVEQVKRLTDGGGLVFEKQAVASMRAMAGLPNHEEQVGDETGDYQKAQELLSSESENAMDQMWDQATQSLSSQELPTITDETGEEQTVALENPADAVWSARGLGILRLVIEDQDSLSNERVKKEELLSNRECLREYCGEGDISVGIGEQLAFRQYLFMKFGHYRNPLEKSHLKYQIEYLIAGTESDYDNLEKIATRISLLRFLMDYRYLSNDAAKIAQAKTVALALTAVAMKPELEPFVTRTLLFAWSYAEAVSDVKRLLDGGKVPMNKTSADWRLGIENIGNFKDELGGAGTETGLSYEEYLRIYLALVPGERLAKRAMDLVETDIRKTSGNEAFRLDNCIVSLDAGVRVVAAGKEYYIRRRFAYDD